MITIYLYIYTGCDAKEAAAQWYAGDEAEFNGNLNMSTDALSKQKRARSLPRLLTCSLAHSLTHSFTHSLTHSPTHSPAHLLTHSLTHSTHSFVHLVALVPMQRVELRWKVNSQRVSWKVNSQRVSALRSFMGGRMTSVAPRVRPSKTW